VVGVGPLDVSLAVVVETQAEAVVVIASSWPVH
jgi:hypothetical protein